METTNTACLGYVPDPYISYSNCTESEFISNWTELCYQPLALREMLYLILPVIGVVGIVGVVSIISSPSSPSFIFAASKRESRQSLVMSSVWREIQCFISSFTSVSVIYCFVSVAFAPTGLFIILDTFPSLMVSAKYLHLSGTL